MQVATALDSACTTESGPTRSGRSSNVPTESSHLRAANAPGVLRHKRAHQCTSVRWRPSRVTRGRTDGRGSRRVARGRRGRRGRGLEVAGVDRLVVPARGGLRTGELGAERVDVLDRLIRGKGV